MTTEPSKPLLDRLKQRIYQTSALQAVGVAGCAAAVPSVYAGTVTVGGPDTDMQDAVAEIERLQTALSEERSAHVQWVRDHQQDTDAAHRGTLLWKRTAEAKDKEIIAACSYAESVRDAWTWLYPKLAFAASVMDEQNMPKTASAFTVHIDQFDAVIRREPQKTVPEIGNIDQGKAGSIPARLPSSGETGERFESADGSRGDKGTGGTPVKAAAESVAGALTSVGHSLPDGVTPESVVAYLRAVARDYRKGLNCPEFPVTTTPEWVIADWIEQKFLEENS